MSYEIPPFSVDVHAAGDEIRLGLAGELDYATVGLFTRAMATVTAEHPDAGVRVDLQDLEFIDSSGMSALMAAHAELAARGARMTVVRGRERVQRPLEVIGMERILDFVDPRESAEPPDVHAK